MKLLPKGKFTWILAAVLIYGLVTARDRESPSPSASDLQHPSPAINVSSDSMSGKFLEKPAEALIKKINETQTGQAMMNTLVQQAIQKQFGESDLTIVSARHTKQTRTQDLKKGIGSQAFCGSTVTVHYDAFMSQHVKFFSTRDLSKPLTFVLGKGETLTGLEQGITGMNAGGTRKIAVPADLAYDDPRFESNMAPPGEVVVFEIELLETKDGPYPPSPRVLTTNDVPGNAIRKVMCGSTVELEYTVLDAYEKPLGTDQNANTGTLSVTLGRGNIPVGLAQGIMGMTEKGSRRIVIPTELMAVPSGKSLLPNTLIFPKDPQELVVFDVKVVSTT